MRIISWNIRAGGGGRIDQIAAAIDGWQPDIAALSEFRATPASDWLAEALADIGLQHQLTTADPNAPAVKRTVARVTEVPDPRSLAASAPAEATGPGSHRR